MSELTSTRVGQLLSQGNQRNGKTEARSEALDELIHLHDAVSENGEEAEQVRQAFLLLMQETPELLSEEKYSRFLVQHVQPEDFAALEWETPHSAVSLCESLYSFEFADEAMSEQVRKHVQNLLRHALHQFERRGELEKMFQLLHFAPISVSSRDGELLRLRNRAYLYEMRRVRRNRRLLHVYLLVQVFLVFLVFPFLFINAENGRIQRQIEEVTEVDVSEPGERPQFLSYSDGLYWSLITAGSIGYGDVTPNTLVGRVIAASLGVMGVITIGVIAGLLLDLITPRK